MKKDSMDSGYYWIQLVERNQWVIGKYNSEDGKFDLGWRTIVFKEVYRVHTEKLMPPVIPKPKEAGYYFIKTNMFSWEIGKYFPSNEKWFLPVIGEVSHDSILDLGKKIQINDET